MLAVQMYKHLSGHAHSGSLGVLQTQQALLNNEVQRLIGASIGLLEILIANMIHEYTELFAEGKSVFDTSGSMQFVETWIRIGRRLGTY